MLQHDHGENQPPTIWPAITQQLHVCWPYFKASSLLLWSLESYWYLICPLTPKIEVKVSFWTLSYSMFMFMYFLNQRLKGRRITSSHQLAASLSRAMSTAPSTSKLSIPIDVISDTVWPWCYIGKRRLDSALADAEERFPQLSFDVRWRPFEVCTEVIIIIYSSCSTITCFPILYALSTQVTFFRFT